MKQKRCFNTVRMFDILFSKNKRKNNPSYEQVTSMKKKKIQSKQRKDLAELRPK